MSDFQTHPTPNPNSIKITTTLGPFVDDGMESFDSPAEAEGHPLGEALFAVPGIENVLILPGFVTISKSPGASWEHMMTKVKKVLAGYFEEQAP